MGAFISLRTGLFDHLAEGRMTANMFAVYAVLHRQCNWDTGLWHGTSWRLLEYLGKSMSFRAIQDNLARLEKLRYIRRFLTLGKKGPYFIAIDKYEPRFGALKGKRLNAWESKSWKSLLWEDGTDDSTDGYIDGGTEGGTDDRTDAAPNPEVTRSNQISQINQNPQNAGGGSSSDQGEPHALSDSPTTKEEQDRFKELRLGEWEKGILTRMTAQGAWRKRDVDLAMRMVLETPEQYPDGITFQSFQGLVEAAAMVVRQ